MWWVVDFVVGYCVLTGIVVMLRYLIVGYRCLVFALVWGVSGVGWFGLRCLLLVLLLVGALIVALAFVWGLSAVCC